eukprot:SAG22_NODE_9601_length_580_cov_0.646570_1_plen_66_part_10
MWRLQTADQNHRGAAAAGSVLETNRSTLLFGCCKSPGRGPVTGQMTRSTDFGTSWAKPVMAEAGQA